jgi:hypothetical protein
MKYLWCEKRGIRLAVAVCLYRKCRHLKEKKGKLVCKFKSKKEKILERREKNGI